MNSGLVDIDHVSATPNMQPQLDGFCFLGFSELKWTAGLALILIGTLNI